MIRQGEVRRETAETRIELSLNLDEPGTSRIQTGIGFLDHMLDLFARHANLNLQVQAVGDLHVDQHHTTEDIGICLGQALEKALGNKSGIRRYGCWTLPMDETLVTAAIDCSGRSFFVFHCEIPTAKIGDFDSELIAEFWQGFVSNARCNLHVILHHGQNSHHIAEGVFKAIARALRMAIELDPSVQGVPSTKGTLSQ
ncbi:MAG: imidazoleglycerol-phosphate dehydratase HisB [Planctomycetota bacterium]|nr:imidazoleglycerol-phosphate dehydratase HisB [Planctomycetota bacterium]MDA1179507.1 imidazoleglycerol-phosphate dehydratase HisB [Planctomycetota bacterium]